MSAPTRAVLIALPLLAGTLAAHAQTTSTIISSFSATPPSPQYPTAPLIRDAQGNLFGTTEYGGIALPQGQSLGTVFELSPPLPGQTAWTQTTLYQFGSNRPDGANPVAGLAADASGNLFTTTQYSVRNPGPGGPSGAVVELSPPAAGHTAWTERVLHLFGNVPGDGTQPSGPVLIDASGNLYATTKSGGAHNAGAVVKLTPIADGNYREKVIYSFARGHDDGFYPEGGLTPGPNGTLLTTTVGGGHFDQGTLVSLRPLYGDAWSDHLEHSFNPSIDGGQPTTAPVFDSAGNFYVTCPNFGPAGAASNGTVTQFRPSATNPDTYTESVIYTFRLRYGTLTNPKQVVADATGALFLTGNDGGAYGYGGVAKLSPQAAAGLDWVETTLYNFASGAADGAFPDAALISDPQGNLFTTTLYGGSATSSGPGTVVELTATGFVPN